MSEATHHMYLCGRAPPYAQPFKTSPLLGGTPPDSGDCE